ncbi:MAG TPA: DUF1684 domain-containing protein [Candidatus Acidoferrales bacterium]|nr:DUF1684 domain-containing protein [Candidatus Acidoferrales bacterium]
MLRLLSLAAAAAILMVAASYTDEIAAWRKQREERLKAPGGWLSVAGLFWLHDGANPFGKDANNEIVLPDGPARAGSFQLSGGKVKVKMDGAERELWPDSADVATVGRLSLYVIQRGEKFGIRLKDPDSQYRRAFHGIDYFPARPEYKVTAKWVAEPSHIPILNVLGQTEEMQSPGYAVFSLQATEYRLRPVLETPDAQELFFIFRDQTSGKETYGAGRFLYSQLPKDGRVVLDFNKAYNPPCAFTPYATCPLPPAQNRLTVRIEAGEKRY